jgi:hypothetical protein
MHAMTRIVRKRCNRILPTPAVHIKPRSDKEDAEPDENDRELAAYLQQLSYRYQRLQHRLNRFVNIHLVFVLSFGCLIACCSYMEPASSPKL